MSPWYWGHEKEVIFFPDGVLLRTKTWNSVIERDSIYFIYHLLSFRTNPMCWVDRVVGSQTTDSLESQNSVVGAQERRKGEGLWARPRVKTGPRSASDATAFFKSHKKNTSLWRSFGEEGLERPQIRQLSRMLIARPLRIMKTVLVPGSNSNRIFSFTDDAVSTGK